MRVILFPCGVMEGVAEMKVRPGRVCLGHANDVGTEVLYAGQIIGVIFSRCGIRETFHVLEEYANGGFCSNVNRLPI